MTPTARSRSLPRMIPQLPLHLDDLSLPSILERHSNAAQRSLTPDFGQYASYAVNRRLQAKALFQNPSFSTNLGDLA